MIVHVPFIYHFAPLFAILGYVYYPKNLRINPHLLFIISVVHNAGLAGFSAWTFLSLIKIIYQKINF